MSAAALMALLLGSASAVAAVAAVAPGGRAARAPALTCEAGTRGVIPGWDLQPSSLAGEHLAALSQWGHDTSSWHHVNATRCTLMGCLLDAGVYRDADLWYSSNLDSVDRGQFVVPWVYRNEFSLAPQEGQHYFLETNGIASRADLYLNGRQIADKERQAGSFGGHTYDITSLVADRNALAIKTYPASFEYDLVQGFVDWNPAAPDNGSGIWREVTVKQSGAVSMGPASVTIDMDLPVERGPARVTVRATAENHEDREVRLAVKSTITDPSGSEELCRETTVMLGARESKTVEMAHTVHEPEIWWPKQWGEQPLYSSELTFSVDSKLSDASKTSFGIRTVSSLVNSHNDTSFAVNGHAFQVIGGGYASDHFLRWDRERFEAIARYTLDMGLNTIRLEGMMEHQELYQVADEMGIMIMAGWVCCSKWEAWEHNHDITLDPFPHWTDNDYETAKASMVHEAEMLQTHPSVIAFLVGSDSWPNDRATELYVDALKKAHWQTPIIASASKRGYPELLGPSGMKMLGPYDWVPPNYWYDTETRLGAASGFGSELGAGVGTPEISSLNKFLSRSDMDDLWRNPDKNLFHMSKNRSSFHNRTLYNQGLFHRYGAPKSLDDYLLKSQMVDYEATRAQHEAYSSRWSARHPATGTIYWMLNSAWPSLHWQLFDHYMHPAGSYFGAKVGSRAEHVAYDYVSETVWIINRFLDRQGARRIDVELVDLHGRALSKQTITATTRANTAAEAGQLSGLSSMIETVAFLRLVLYDDTGATLSRNVYWVPKAVDALDWNRSTWFHTPVTRFADLTPLGSMQTAEVALAASARHDVGESGQDAHALELENLSSVPAFFLRLALVDENGDDINPVIWSDNYVTLWPHEKLHLAVSYKYGGGGVAKVRISGGNVESSEVTL